MSRETSLVWTSATTSTSLRTPRERSDIDPRLESGSAQRLEGEAIPPRPDAAYRDRRSP